MSDGGGEEEEEEEEAEPSKQTQHAQLDLCLGVCVAGSSAGLVMDRRLRLGEMMREARRGCDGLAIGMEIFGGAAGARPWSARYSQTGASARIFAALEAGAY